MTKVRIAIVEDEKIFSDILSHTLKKLGYEPLKPDTSYAAALETLEKYNPDIAMVDIRLKGKKDGVDLAMKINEDYKIPFIFLTSNADKVTIDRAKKVNPPAYLIKPFNEKELYTSIELALYSHAQKKDRSKSNFVINDALFIKQKDVFIKLKFDNILFIKSDHIYIEIVTVDNQKYLVRDSLNEYINKLTNSFVRVQRGYIVNLNHLQTITKSYIKIDKYNIPIGKNYRDELMKRVNLV